LRKLDKYILKEMIGPFVFGVGAFIIVLVSIDLLYDALRLIVREGYPAGLVARAFAYRMPQTITLTLPMATMFGARIDGHRPAEQRRGGGGDARRRRVFSALGRAGAGWWLVGVGICLGT